MTAYNSATLYDSSTTYGGIPISDRPQPTVLVGRVAGWTGGASGILQDISADVASIEITRGRSGTTYDKWNPGTCTLELEDTDARYYPSASGLYTFVGGWVSVQMTRGQTGGGLFDLFTGIADRIETEWSPGAEFARVNVSALDYMRALNSAETSLPGTAGDRPVDRINAILDDIGFAAARSIDTLTTVTLAEDESGPRNAITPLQKIEQAESGALFCGPDGSIRFRGRGFAWPAANPKVLFTDDDTITDGASYNTLRSVSADDVVLNRVTVQSSNWVDQTATDTASYESDGPHATTIGGSLIRDQIAAQDLAWFLLGKRSDAAAKEQFEGLQIEAFASEANREAALTLDLLDVVRLERRASSVVTLVSDLVIVGIRHRITATSWLVEFITQARV